MLGHGSAAVYMCSCAADSASLLALPFTLRCRDTPVRADGTPTDIDEERVLFFATMDETMSLYAADNAQKYLGMNETTFEALRTGEWTADPFQDVWSHRSINGYMFCNMPRLQLPAGARARLHFMALGDIADMHTPNMGRGGGFINFGQVSSKTRVHVRTTPPPSALPAVVAQHFCTPGVPTKTCACSDVLLPSAARGCCPIVGRRHAQRRYRAHPARNLGAGLQRHGPRHRGH